MESKELEDILHSHANWAHQWPTQKTGTYIYGNGKQTDTVSTKAAILAWHTAKVERAKKAAAAEALRNVAGVFRESDEISDSTEAEKYARTLDRYAEQLQPQTKKGQI